MYEITAGSHETEAPQDPLTPTKSSSIEEDASFRMQQIFPSGHMTKTPSPPLVSTNIPSPPVQVCIYNFHFLISFKLSLTTFNFYAEK